MASIRQRAGKWQARVTRKGYPQEVKSFNNRTDALRWARELELAMDRGSYHGAGEADRLPLRDLMDRYLRQVTPTKRGATDEAIRLRALQRSRLASFTLETLTPSEIAAFWDQRLATVRAGAVIRDLSLLSSVINHARREWGVTAENPCALVRKPRAPTGRSRLLTPDEQTSLLLALAPTGRRNPLMQPLVMLALETAMRRGELLALQWKHVDLERKVAFLEITKNGQSRAVPLSSKAILLLASLKTGRVNGGKVFPIQAASVHTAFRRACTRAGVADLRFHDLRHCAATRMADKLSNVLELSAVTGHQTIQMLKRYYHPSATALAEKLG